MRIRITEGSFRGLLTGRRGHSNLPDVPHVDWLETFSENNQEGLETVTRGDRYNHRCTAVTSGSICGRDSLTWTQTTVTGNTARLR